jgi:hypothetical protein
MRGLSLEGWFTVLQEQVLVGSLGNSIEKLFASLRVLHIIVSRDRCLPARRVTRDVCFSLPFSLPGRCQK